MTLFLGGRFIRGFLDLVRRMVAEGHEIATHLDTLRQTDRPHEALPHLLESLQARACRLVPVSTLLAHPGGHHTGAASHAAPRPSPKVQPPIR